jgi:hypothetical protein
MYDIKFPKGLEKSIENVLAGNFWTVHSDTHQFLIY